MTLSRIAALPREGAANRPAEDSLPVRERLTLPVQGLAELSLESPELMRGLLEATPDAVILKDPTGSWQLANPAALKLFGLENVAYHGRTDLELARVSPALASLQPLCARSDVEVWQGEQPARSRQTVEAAPGDHRYYDIFKIPLYWPDGRAKGLLVMGRDVTSLRSAHQALASNEEHHLLAQEVAGLGSFSWDLATGEEYWSHQTYRILGLDPRQVEAGLESLTRVVHSLHREALARAMATTRERGVSGNLELEIVQPGGEHRQVLLRAKLFEDSLGGAQRILGTILDITDKKRQETELLLTHQILEKSSEAVMVTDAQDRIQMVNRAFSDLTGYAAEEVLGVSPTLLKFGLHSREFYRRIRESLAREGKWHGEIWNRSKDGMPRPLDTTITAVKDQAGAVVNYVALFHDLSGEKQSQEEISYQAQHDSLTGLLNRAALAEKMRALVERSSRQAADLAMIYLDLDRFKHINETLGHGVGDSILAQVANRLVRTMGPLTPVSRLGGDEFIIVLEGAAAGPAGLGQALTALTQAFQQPFRHQGRELFLTHSLGIARFPDDGTDPDTLMKNAEMAMYQAKNLGRDGHQFFTPALFRGAARRLDLENALRRALDRQELVVLYQPQVDLEQKTVTGAEALVRWQRPGAEGLVPPSEFIPLAEDTGLIVPIGLWVLKEACRQTKAWHARGLDHLKVSVNLSARQLSSPDLVASVEKVLAQTGLEPRFLELELTETTLMNDVQEATRVLKALAALGVVLSVDDFGTGYSSLYYLKHFPIDRLKIDHSFVRDLAVDADAAAIVKTVIFMAYSLRLEAVAEGVENWDQISFLRQHGCHGMQGFHFGRPVTSDEFLRRLRDGSIFRRFAPPPGFAQN
ncbi:MAG: EAL domain-containing protein [Deltaproteobacteria bacterium]|nr:EAL domain-containing protein [Deltaproteobacteria bacterium]